MLVCPEQLDKGGHPAKSRDSGQTPNKLELTGQYLLFSTVQIMYAEHGSQVLFDVLVAEHGLQGSL